MLPRKFLTAEGYPEDPNWVKKNTEKNVRGANPDDFVHGREVLLALKKLGDLKEIDEILEKDVRRSDGENVEIGLHTIPVAFEVRPQEGDSSRYNSMADQITVDPDELSLIADKLGISIESLLLLTLCHEKVHRFSSGHIKGAREFQSADSLIVSLKNAITRLRGQTVDKPVLEEVTGYKRKMVKHDEDFGHISETDSYTNLDEGINEKRAVEVMQEYLRTHRDSIPKDDWLKMTKLNTDEEHRSPFYHDETLFVDNLISYLSEKSELPKYVVWQAIKRGKFGKENTNDRDTLINEDNTSEVLKEALSDNAELYRKIFNDEKINRIGG